MKPFIIAEAGACHDGKLKQAVELVEAAREAGCQAVKFQYWSDAKALAARRHAEVYVAIYQRYALPVDWLEPLARAAEAAGIEFMATSYLPQDVAVVAPYVSRFKIASFEARDRAFLIEHNLFDKPVVLSTGMMTMPEVEASAAALRHLDALLHCCSAYPAPIGEIHLGAIREIRARYQFYMALRVGFSDHTRLVTTGGLAVAAGADILEVHLRAPGTAKGNPDYRHSLVPKELREYVEFAHTAASMLGDGPKRLMDAEQPMALYRAGP